MGITASSLNLTDFDIEREYLRSRRFLFLLSRVQTSLRAGVSAASLRASLSLFCFFLALSYNIASPGPSSVFKREEQTKRRRQVVVEEEELTFSLSLSLLHKRARAQRFLRIVPTSSRPPRFKRYTKDSNNSIKSTKDTSARTSC